MEKPLRIVFFDGVCNFCNYWVQFALKRDHKDNLRFAPLQGQTAKNLLSKAGIDHNIITSVVFFDDSKVFTESSAVLEICRYLDGGWKLLRVFHLIPAFMRNAVYRWVGRNRYKWFGQKDTCMIPTPEIRNKFLD